MNISGGIASRCAVQQRAHRSLSCYPRPRTSPQKVPRVWGVKPPRPAGSWRSELHGETCNLLAAKLQMQAVLSDVTGSFERTRQWFAMHIAVPLVFLVASAGATAGTMTFKEEADALVDAGQYNEAIEMYNRALQADPERPGARWGRAAANMALANYDTAIDDYSMLLQQNDGDSAPLVYFARARAEAAVENWSEASADYGLAADGFLRQKDRRSYGAAQGLRGVTAFESGDVQEAQKILEGLARGRYNSDVRLVLVALHWSKGEVEQAEDLWDSTCQIELAQCSRYRDINWLRTERGWPPSLISSMQDFLSIK